MELLFKTKEMCSGCGACLNACPSAAIGMKPDPEGFLYPEIDADKCTGCKICAEACPFAAEHHFKENAPPAFYAATHRDESVLMNSSSGGAFTAVSDFILARGGAVYGAGFDEEFQALHSRAATPAERDRFRASKYVQSRTHGAYADALTDLREGRPVLFSGTPCQTAGLRALARLKETDSPNLYTCDLICHSIPSPLVWRDYILLLERENGGQLRDVHFRSKSLEWTRKNTYRSFRFLTSGSGEYKSDTRFYKLFFKVRTIVRRSCCACPFTDVRRAADITIADYWGIEKYAPELYDPRGVSVVMVNSEKGQEIFDFLRHEMTVHERPAEESIAEQPRLSTPEKLPPNREEFWGDYLKFGFDYILEKYL